MNLFLKALHDADWEDANEVSRVETLAKVVEQLKADPAVAKHFKPGELEKLCSLDFHLKEVNHRFRKLGL